MPFTDAQVFRVPVKKTGPVWREKHLQEDLLFDLREGDDMSQNIAADSPATVARMRRKLVAELRRIGAPEEQFQRLGLV